MMNLVNKRLTIYLNLNFPDMAADEVPDSLIMVLKALSDESRARIVKILSQEEKSTKELSEILGFTPGTVSIHLKILKEAKVLKARKDKNFVYYSVIPGVIEEICSELNTYFGARP